MGWGFRDGPLQIGCPYSRSEKGRCPLRQKAASDEAASLDQEHCKKQRGKPLARKVRAGVGRWQGVFWEMFWRNEEQNGFGGALGEDLVGRMF
ncbi:MAG: hypothetical protein D6722_20790 [Bacteroidetes bacterium]|nr:MAG: hypothetical protein D6722_20790 [Bacteroidota bacterium]